MSAPEQRIGHVRPTADQNGFEVWTGIRWNRLAAPSDAPQEYTHLSSFFVDPIDGDDVPDRTSVCKGCGAVVADTAAHDRFHAWLTGGAR